MGSLDGFVESRRNTNFVVSIFYVLFRTTHSNSYTSGNWSIDVLFKHLHFEKNESTGEYTAYKKVDSSVGMVQKVDLGKSIFSFVPPA